MLRILLLVNFIFCAPVFAESTFNDAITAYDHADFKKSVEIYENLIQSGIRNGSVYYNLGNSYFRLGEKGKAVAAYLAARSLLPRDPDVRANLKFAHEQAVDKLSLHAPSSVFRDLSFWIDMTTPKEIFYTSGILACLALCFLCLSLLVKSFIPLRLWSLLFSCLAFLGFGMFGTSLYYEEHWGTVSTPGISEVRSGPGELNTVVFQVHEGAPFLVEATQKDWYRIRLSDDKVGWIQGKNISTYL